MAEKLSDWDKFVKYVEDEARREGPEAVAEMERLDAKYRRIAERLERQAERRAAQASQGE